MNVALTFDDGPSEWTAPILDILAAHNAKATFFVCGAHILGNVPLIDRIHRDGHELGDHTTNHPDLTALTPDLVRAELAETAAMLHAVTGELPAVWRAPYLRWPQGPQPFLGVGCSVLPEDWCEPDAQVIADRVLASPLLQEGIVLLHDGRPPGQPRFDDGGSLDTREQTVEATRILVPALLERGYTLVTASELLAPVTV